MAHTSAVIFYCYLLQHTSQGPGSNFPFCPLFLNATAKVSVLGCNSKANLEIHFFVLPDDVKQYVIFVVIEYKCCFAVIQFNTEVK